MHLTALGSSFASGPGIPLYANVSASRSTQNYPHLLAHKLNANLTDLTTAGATLLNLLSEPQTLPAGEICPPQISLVPRESDIVTLTCGGNDLGYIGSLTHASLMASYGQTTEELPPPLLSMEQLTARMGAVVDAIHARAPGARVLLVEYLPVLGMETRP